MTRKYCLVIFLFQLLTIISGCSGHSDTPTPRPVAYPRLSVAPETYHPINAAGVSLEINDAAVDSLYARQSSTWLNITYPAYCNGSVIYCTITPTSQSEIDRVIDNRLERIALNLGGSPAEVTNLQSPAGWDCRIVKALSPIVTPLQFIASGNEKVITGAYYISAPGDSVAPLIDAVERDIIHLLKTLK